MIGINLSINRPLTTVATPLLLDTYSGAAAAYSLRKLSNSYSGSAIRVRRSSDNTEQDIGFDGNGNLNESSLTSFVGSNSGYVTKWYDQSGNARDVIQTDANQQPRIINSGSIEKINNKPALFYNGINTMHLYNTTTNIDSSTNYVYSVNNTTNKIIYTVEFRRSGTTKTPQIFYSSPSMYLYTDGVNGSNNAYKNDANLISNNVTYIVNHILIDGQKIDLYLNGSQITGITQTGSVAAPTGSTGFTIGERAINKTAIHYQPEIIIYNSDQSSNRTGIESNINSYYSIY